MDVAPGGTVSFPERPAMRTANSVGVCGVMALRVGNRMPVIIGRSTMERTAMRCAAAPRPNDAHSESLVYRDTPIARASSASGTGAMVATSVSTFT